MRDFQGRDRSSSYDANLAHSSPPPRQQTPAEKAAAANALAADLDTHAQLVRDDVRAIHTAAAIGDLADWTDAADDAAAELTLLRGLVERAPAALSHADDVQVRSRLEGAPQALADAEALVAGAPAVPKLAAPIVRCADALMAVLPADRSLGWQAERALLDVVHAQATYADIAALISILDGTVDHPLSARLHQFSRVTRKKLVRVLSDPELQGPARARQAAQRQARRAHGRPKPIDTTQTPSAGATSAGGDGHHDGDATGGPALAEALRGEGGPLPHREDMERSFGRSFGDVKAHTDMGAELSPLGAQALTVGNQVAFADAAPSPALVAHEATHVVQNEQAGASAAMASGIVAPRDSAAESEADAIAGMVATHGPGIKLPPISAAPASQLQLAPASATSTSAADPLDAFVVGAKQRGLSLSPAHPVLDRTFSARPIVQAWLSSTSGPPPGQAVQIEWQLLDARSAALSGSSSLWAPLQPQSPPASFPVQQAGDYQVIADILHSGHKLARIAAPLHVERSPDALHAAMSLTPETRSAEQERRRSAVADPSKPAGERKQLDDERAKLEFAAHEQGDPALSMPDPGPDAVDFGAAQWGAPTARADQSWVVSTDPVFLRAMVEREYAKGGELAVLEMIGHMQNKANLARDRQANPAEGSRLWRLGWDIASAMGQQYELLKHENALFLADYEKTARAAVDYTLTQSEQRTLAEIAKYGLTRDEVTDVVETSDRGWKRKQRTTYAGGDTAGGKELAAVAAELVASQREIDKMRARIAKTQLDLFGARSPNPLSPGQVRHPEQVGSLETQLAQLEHKSAVAEAAHFSAAHQREQSFPVLASYRKVEDHRVTFDVAKLEKLGGADSRREEIAPHLFGILDNIKKTREGLKPGGDLSIWKEDRVRQLTMPQMLIVTGSVRERAVLEKTAQEKRGGWGTWAIAALTAGLAVLAAIPTGGSSLAVGIVAIAEVAGAALDVYLVADQLEEFHLQKAAAGTDMDKARALSAEDPSLFWLAIEMVMAGVSLGVAAKSLKQLRHARDAAKAAGTTAKIDDALATIRAEHRAWHISADAAKKLEDEVRTARGAGADSAGQPHAKIEQPREAGPVGPTRDSPGNHHTTPEATPTAKPATGGVKNTPTGSTWARDLDGQQIEHVRRQLGDALASKVSTGTRAFTGPELVEVADTISRLRRTRNVRGVDDWIAFEEAHDAAHMRDAIAELRSVERRAAENTGKTYDIGHDAHAPVREGTINARNPKGDPMRSFDIAEYDGNDVSRSIEVTSIDQPVEQASNLTKGVRHATDKVAARLEEGIPIPGKELEAEIQIELFQGEVPRGTGTITYDGIGNYTYRVNNGKITPPTLGRNKNPGNIFSDFAKALPPIGGSNTLSVITLVDRSGNVIATFRREDSIWKWLQETTP